MPPRKHGSLALLLLSFLTLTSPQGRAAPASTAPLTGEAAFGDWTMDAPGINRLIEPSDLPQPNATKSDSNGPHIVKQPDGASLKVPQGFAVSALVTGLTEPRQMRAAPNGDIFVAESSAGRIRVIRIAADGQTVASNIFVDQLDDRPFGIAFYPAGNKPQYIYIATETRVLRFPYQSGDLKTSAQPQTIVSKLPEGHHWTRDIQFTPDGRQMLVSVGSGSNDAEAGIGEEKNRADILAFNPDGTNMHILASALRNPVTINFHPDTGDLWTTVNERDGLGDNLPPDYVTRVKPGGFYGWPYFYIGPHEDPLYAGQKPGLRNQVITPDVLFQPHSAPLGFAVYEGRQFPAEYRGDLFVAMHGSWNRSKRTGYKLVRIRLDHGKPTGIYQDFLTGFVTPEGNVWGRPVGVAVAADGSLLMSDDASGTIWRVSYKGSAPN